MKLRHAIALGIGLTTLSAAHGADAFTDALNAAYPSYRAALFRTNSKSQTESEQAITKTLAAWRDLSATYGSKPPAPYDRDDRFAPTLAEIQQVFDAANQEIRSGKLAEAHETLEAARDLMAELRRRNGVIVYSDHMNAYHAEMEVVLNEGAKLLGEPQGFMLLMARVGTLDYLAERLRTEAPAALAANADFEPAVKAVEDSLAGLRAAVMAQDAAQVKAALAKVKAPYSKLFLKYG
ncbi:MAG: hypothetical protein R3E87_02200 [Burkholderiaceae bacterium]